ncbi:MULTISPECIES: Lin1244/Lin1753 domain-containing protein [Enterococcus]|uniref:Lin1244/Lin1753 domain-containing protein n=1 Tax=Enterococcus TaxID=1350 RepID=UPI000C264594|nr:Lin1244/Lin1753 domain-containing protein [Enterococcus mundtii]PJK27083.1 DNA replication protein DnaD [Enterococcus mundtii]
MARPTKDGIDYFPLDVDVFEDEKIEAIAGEFGLKGEIAVIKLLCAIYKKGYFILWNDLTQATLLKRLPGVSKEMLNQIVNRLVIWGFFDKELFDSVEVLTSENIQATYFEATKRRKSPKPTKYVINVNNNTQDERDNDDINPQSKVNESKVNKIDEEDMGVYEFIQVSWGKPPTGLLQGALGPMIKKWGSDIILFAFKLAFENSVEMPGLKKYVEAILESWSKQNIKTLDDALKAQEDYKNRKKKQFHTPKYQKNVRREKLPDWVNKPQEEQKIDPEKKAEIDARFEDYFSRTSDEKEGASN